MDESQRMLNAIEPGTVIPVHRHPGTSEDVAILRGKAEEVFYDSEGHEVSRCLLSPGGDVPAVHVPMGQFHTCHSLQTGTVIIEVKNTKYDPQGTELLGNEFEDSSLLACLSKNLNNFYPQINCGIGKKLYLCSGK